MLMMMMMPEDVFAKEGGNLGLILSCFACSLGAGKYTLRYETLRGHGFRGGSCDLYLRYIP